jgi:hypothetical protein
MTNSCAPPTRSDISYSEFITRLVRAQWQAGRRARWSGASGAPICPSGGRWRRFPFARQPGVNRKQIRGFAELEFIAKAENIVFCRRTGRGKTGLACGLLLKALENGYRCQFIKAQDLFDEMYASLADRSTRQLLKRLARLDVLLVDELGYLNLKPEQSNIFFKLMEERYRQHSTIITTNLGYDEWPNFLGNRPMVEALLSRCGITATRCTSTVRRCANRRAEEQRCGPWPRPGRICSPGAGGVSEDAGHDGNRSAVRTGCWRRNCINAAFGAGDRKRLGAGGHAPPDSARRCAALGHDSLAGLFPAGDRGSAGTARQPGLLRISPPQARTRIGPMR